MTQEQYIKITDSIRKSKFKTALLFIIVRILPVLIGLLYLLIGAVLLLAAPVFVFRYFAVPLITFIFITGARKIIDRPRPYEVMKFTPVSFKKNLKAGQSFPSRHTGCAAVIAIAILAYDLPLGLVMLLLAILVGLSRIIAGVHYISDVCAGMALGIIIGLIGFYPVIF